MKSSVSDDSFYIESEVEDEDEDEEKGTDCDEKDDEEEDNESHSDASDSLTDSKVGSYNTTWPQSYRYSLLLFLFQCSVVFLYLFRPMQQASRTRSLAIESCLFQIKLHSIWIRFAGNLWISIVAYILQVLHFWARRLCQDLAVHFCPHL